jgi:hypothetical protein
MWTKPPDPSRSGRPVQAATIVSVLWSLSAFPASAQKVNIVGLGAASCAHYIRDIEKNPNLQRDYFAWAQGFMSGIILRSPPGVDEKLNLNPPTFPLLKQIEFIRVSCTSNPSQDYSDAVTFLYRRLREESPT